MKTTKRFSAFMFAGICAAALFSLTTGFVHAEEEEEEGEELALKEGKGPMTADLREESHLSTYYQVAALRKMMPSSAAPWESRGPTGVGRINVVEVDPTNDQIVYTGAAGGGVWKSTNGGTTQTMIFSDNCTKNGSYWPCDQSIGAIAVDPNPNQQQTIWVGGGENMYGGGSNTYPGTGIFKSTDGGTSWKWMGLDSSFYISRITVTPGNSDKVFVAVQGSVWGKNKDRGIYRTTNGGTTWEMVLGPGKNIPVGDDSTGAVEVRIHPTNPNRIFANFFTALRVVYTPTWGGPNSRVWLSEDGGDTWRTMGAAEGLPTTDLGKSTMDICASNPNIAYMVYFTGSNTLKNVYKSTDGGMHWAVTGGTPNGSSLYSYYAHTFGQIRVNPSDANDVIVLGISSQRSVNGGTSWSTVFSGAHSDHRTMAWSRTNTNLVYLGDDGSLKKSTTGAAGTLTSVSANMNIAQLYALDIAPGDNANYMYNGLQDNGANYTTNGGTSWSSYVGGDGMQIHVDHGNTNYVIGGSQYGAFQLSTNRGSSRSAISGYTGRKLWDAGIALDSATGFTYVGSQYAFRAARGSASYTQISNDLTNGDHSLANYPMGTISAMSAHNNVLFVGTDDGNVWVNLTANTATPTSGWIRIRNGNGTGPGTGNLAFDGWIKLISPDYSDATGRTAFIAVNYFRWGIRNWKPTIYKVTMNGTTADMREISGDLPPRINTNKVVKGADGNLYAATDYGMFFSNNNGVNWLPFGNGLPVVPVNDLVIHQQTNYLYIGTYGRGIWRYPIGSVVGIDPNAKLAGMGGQVLNNFPNPVVNSTTIQFKVTSAQDLDLAIYDLSGRKVKELLRKPVEADKTYDLVWDRTDDRGARVEHGAYILRAIGDKVTLARKLLLQ